MQEPRFIVTFNKKENEDDGKRRAVKRGAKEDKSDDDDGAVRGMLMECVNRFYKCNCSFISS